MTTVTISEYSISMPGGRELFPPFQPALTLCSAFRSQRSRRSFSVTCDLRPGPVNIFIVSGLTLTCGHWALSNGGDMRIEAPHVKR